MSEIELQLSDDPKPKKSILSNGIERQKHQENDIEIYLDWANSHLENQVISLQDFSTAVLYVDLIQKLCGKKPLKVIKESGNLIKKMENFNSLFEWLRSMGLDIRHVDPHSLAMGNEQSLMSLLFAVRRFYEGKEVVEVMEVVDEEVEELRRENGVLEERVRELLGRLSGSGESVDEEGYKERILNLEMENQELHEKVEMYNIYAAEYKNTIEQQQEKYMKLERDYNDVKDQLRKAMEHIHHDISEETLSLDDSVSDVIPERENTIDESDEVNPSRETVESSDDLETLQEVSENDFDTLQEVSESDDNELGTLKEVSEEDPTPLKDLPEDLNTLHEISEDDEFISIRPKGRGHRDRELTEENLKQLVKMKACIRRYLDKRIYKRYRKKVFSSKELYSTEESYLNGLHELKSNFIDPIKESNIVEDSIRSKIFSEKELDIIMMYNEQVKNDLREIINDNMNYYTIIGLTLKAISKFLKMYTVYVNNYDVSMSTLVREKKKNEKFRNFLDEIESGGNLGIDSYLVLPIQRPPRYVMLLDDIVKNTHYSHPDYEDLVTTLKTMRDVADYINTRKAEADSQIQVGNVFNSFPPKDERILELVGVPSRRYLFESEAQLQPAYDKKKMKYIFCFNDLVLIAKPPHRNVHRYIADMPLTFKTVVEEDSEALMVKVTTGHQIIEFYFQDSKNCEKWFLRFQDIVYNHVKVEKVRQKNLSGTASPITWRKSANSPDKKPKKKKAKVNHRKKHVVIGRTRSTSVIY